jgi:sugar-specific transcriptional regulator TrmB
MFTKEFAKVLNLTNDESSVLKALERGHVSMTDLASITKIPRTTLYTTVKTLKERTFIERYKVKNKTIICLTEKNKIDSILFTESTHKNSNNEEWLKNPDFKIIYGLENLIDVYEKITNQKNQRMHTIQPTSSMLASIKKVKPEKLVELNESVKKNKIVFDAIIHQNYMTKYMDTYLGESDHKQTQESLLKSLENRMAEMSIIDNEYLNVGSEIFFTDTQLYILNWEDELAISVENREIIALIKGLFNFAKNHSIKVNYHELIGKYLERVKK